MTNETHPPAEKHPIGQKLRWRPAKRQLRAFVGVIGLAGCALLAFVLSQLIPSIPATVIFVVTLGLLIVLIVLIGGYYFNWAWTGFGTVNYEKKDNQEVRRGKTLWDWMQLLIIPAVLAGGALLFNQLNTQTQNKIADDNQRQTALQMYFDRMSDLLLSKDSSDPDKLRAIERTRTLTTLRQLVLDEGQQADEARQGILLQFLRDSKVFSSTSSIIDLSGADLHSIKLTHANLNGVDLSGAYLGDADRLQSSPGGASYGVAPSAGRFSFPHQLQPSRP